MAWSLGIFQDNESKVREMPIIEEERVVFIEPRYILGDIISNFHQIVFISLFTRNNTGVFPYLCWTNTILLTPHIGYVDQLQIDDIIL